MKSILTRNMLAIMTLFPWMAEWSSVSSVSSSQQSTCAEQKQSPEGHAEQCALRAQTDLARRATPRIAEQHAGGQNRAAAPAPTKLSNVPGGQR